MKRRSALWEHMTDRGQPPELVTLRCSGILLRLLHSGRSRGSNTRLREETGGQTEPEI